MASAKKMAMQLRQLYRLLLDEHLIECDSVSAFEKAASLLEAQKDKASWGFSITRTDPIRFCLAHTKKINRVQPILQAKLDVSGDQQDGMRGCFAVLNTTLELHSEGKLLDRWHVDLANDDQEGPIFHLQYGGHSSGNTMRNIEQKLSVPRWIYPPLDIVLACELVVANFFPETWLRLRKDPKWMALVREAESFCYTDYFNTFSKHYSDPSRKETMLQKLWAS